MVDQQNRADQAADKAEKARDSGYVTKKRKVQRKKLKKPASRTKRQEMNQTRLG